MEFKQLFDDERAVSPVIGVILMVAITVILAAVIGTFVLGLGDQVQQTTPRVSLGFDTADSKTNVTITHESGDTVDAASLVVKSGTAFSWNSQNTAKTNSAKWSNISSPGDVSAGSSARIGAGNYTDSTDGDFAGSTIRVVYDSPDSDNTATLGKFEVPS